MKDRKRLCLAALAGLVLCTALASAQDWPQWRGPRGQVRRSASRLRPRGPIGRSRSGRFRRAPATRRPSSLPGACFCSRGSGEQEAVSARDLATGKEIWRAAYDAPYQMNSGRDVARQGTEVDAGRTIADVSITFGISGILSAWQAQDGRLLWRSDFKKDFPSTSPDFGVAMSPIVVGDLVIVHAGGIGNGAVLGLDVATGDHEMVVEGRRPGVRVADRRRHRRDAPDHHAVAASRGRPGARRRTAALGDPVHDRVRAEQHHARRRERPG